MVSTCSSSEWRSLRPSDWPCRFFKEQSCLKECVTWIYTHSHVLMLMILTCSVGRNCEKKGNDSTSRHWASVCFTLKLWLFLFEPPSCCLSNWMGERSSPQQPQAVFWTNFMSGCSSHAAAVRTGFVHSWVLKCLWVINQRRFSWNITSGWIQSHKTCCSHNKNEMRG